MIGQDMNIVRQLGFELDILHHASHVNQVFNTYLYIYDTE